MRALAKVLDDAAHRYGVWSCTSRTCHNSGRLIAVIGGIYPSAAVKCVMPRTADQLVISTEPEQQVVTTKSMNGIIHSVIAVKGIIARGAIDNAIARVNDLTANVGIP